MSRKHCLLCTIRALKTRVFLSWMIRINLLYDKIIPEAKWSTGIPHSSMVRHFYFFDFFFQNFDEFLEIEKMRFSKNLTNYLFKIYLRVFIQIFMNIGP